MKLKYISSFNIPNLYNHIPWQSTVLPVGNYGTGSVPNITGYIGMNPGGLSSGAFYNEGGSGYNFNGMGGAITKFDASRSSLIYTNNTDRVVPAYCTTIYCIKY